jgi:hypothetical protein
MRAVAGNRLRCLYIVAEVRCSQKPRARVVRHVGDSIEVSRLSTRQVYDTRVRVPVASACLHVVDTRSRVSFRRRRRHIDTSPCIYVLSMHIQLPMTSCSGESWRPLAASAVDSHVTILRLSLYSVDLLQFCHVRNIDLPSSTSHSKECLKWQQLIGYLYCIGIRIRLCLTSNDLHSSLNKQHLGVHSFPTGESKARRECFTAIHSVVRNCVTTLHISVSLPYVS